MLEKLQRFQNLVCRFLKRTLVKLEELQKLFIQITKWQLQYLSDYVMQSKICNTKFNGNNNKLNVRISLGLNRRVLVKPRSAAEFPITYIPSIL